jgi:hypothetical protein
MALVEMVNTRSFSSVRLATQGTDCPQRSFTQRISYYLPGYDLCSNNEALKKALTLKLGNGGLFVFKY